MEWNLFEVGVRFARDAGDGSKTDGVFVSDLKVNIVPQQHQINTKTGPHGHVIAFECVAEAHSHLLRILKCWAHFLCPGWHHDGRSGGSATERTGEKAVSDKEAFDLKIAVALGEAPDDITAPRLH